MREQQAEKLYAECFKVAKNMVGNKTTFLTQLDKAGKKLFKRKFRGVYPSDKIPILNDLVPYCILNLDRSDQNGSHWIAVVKLPNKDEIMVYDSFGRHHKKIIPYLSTSGNGKVTNTDLDIEQRILSTDCGARSLGFLLCFDKYGEEVAQLI